MRRRGFIKRLFGVATTAVVGDKIADSRRGVFDNSTIGEPFGLVPAKAEGTSMVYDHLNAFDAIRDGVTKKLLGPLETIEIEIDD